MPISWGDVDWYAVATGRKMAAGKKKSSKKVKRKQRRARTIVPTGPRARMRAALARDDEFITRSQLAQLRDEVETVLRRSEDACSLVHSRCHSLEREYHQTKRVEEKMLLDIGIVQEMLALEGGAKGRPSPHVRREPVSWSYFHSWITRINKRLDEIEAKCISSS